MTDISKLKFKDGSEYDLKDASAREELLAKANKTDVYTKTEIDSKLAGAFHYKGQVATEADLPTEGNQVGDVYNVEKTGANFAWDGTKWDKLSEKGIPTTITSTDAYGYLDVFCNGIPVEVEAGDDANSIKIYYDNHTQVFVANRGTTKGIRLYGGCADLGYKTYLPTTSIIMHSGNFASMFGGSINSGYVGIASITINGGTVSGGVGAGRSDGSNPSTEFHDNTVGQFNLIVNNCDYLLTAYGASNGYSTVNRSYVEINGGHIAYAVAAAANGNSSYIEYVVNGGNLDILQSHSRGKNGKVKMVVNGGTVTQLFAGAELDEATPNVYQKLEMHLLGGTISKTVAGSCGVAGVADISKLSGTYKDGVIVDDEGNLKSKLTRDATDALKAQVDALQVSMVASGETGTLEVR